MDALEKFLELVPSSNVRVYPDQIVYVPCNTTMLKYWENKARNMIMLHNLPLVVETNLWGIGGKDRSATMIVKEAPEEYAIADECQDDEGLTGGWWKPSKEVE